MKRTSIPKKGKLFYILLGAMIIFINVPIVIVLILTQQALANSHAQLQSILNDVLSVQMEYIQGSNPGHNPTDTSVTRAFFHGGTSGSSEACTMTTSHNLYSTPLNAVSRGVE